MIPAALAAETRLLMKRGDTVAGSRPTTGPHAQDPSLSVRTAHHFSRDCSPVLHLLTWYRLAFLQMKPLSIVNSQEFLAHRSWSVRQAYSRWFLVS